jgi:uncharacterized protein YdeI (YjbR/CyaY-like superfamily)
MREENPEVSNYLAQTKQWQCEMRKLRSILLACGLEETLKWRKPCYTHEGRNVAIIQPFKPCCALMFFQGVLLEDTHHRLRSQGPNSRSAMRLEFTSERDIVKRVVNDYVQQAIQLERDGRRVKIADTNDAELPTELRDRLNSDRTLRKAFESLTPGRQRGYALHIGGAKQSKTRALRTDNCVPAILAGKGLHDR